MDIMLNGRAVTTAATDLAALLIEQGLSQKTATARNGDFVPVALRAATKLQNGDQIEALTAMQGG